MKDAKTYMYMKVSKLLIFVDKNLYFLIVLKRKHHSELFCRKSLIHLLC